MQNPSPVINFRPSVVIQMCTSECAAHLASLISSVKNLNIFSQVTLPPGSADKEIYPYSASPEKSSSSKRHQPTPTSPNKPKNQRPWRSILSPSATSLNKKSHQSLRLTLGKTTRQRNMSTTERNTPSPGVEDRQTYYLITSHTSWFSTKMEEAEDNGIQTISFTLDAHSETILWTPKRSKARLELR
jgi:hypothetical protein